MAHFVYIAAVKACLCCLQCIHGHLTLLKNVYGEYENCVWWKCLSIGEKTLGFFKKSLGSFRISVVFTTLSKAFYGSVYHSSIVMKYK